MSFGWQELVGYLGSALVVTSLAMTSVVRLRAISLLGSITFLVYGLLIGAAPIVITNVVIIGLNVWFLRRELGGGRDLGAVVVPPDSPFLADFLRNHANRIGEFQPDFDLADPFDFALVLTREGLPAGVVLGRRQGERLHVDLDYVIRAYRDSRLGNWLYGDGARVLRSEGIDVVTSDAGSPSHRPYLVRMGFEPDPATGLYSKTLP